MNELFNFNKKGKIIKNVIEGIIIKIILYDKSIIFCDSLVSQYIQIKARKEVSGREAINPANIFERFAISPIKTTTTEVMIILTIRYSMYLMAT